MGALTATAVATIVLGVAQLWMKEILQWMANASQDLLETSLRVENASWLSGGLISGDMITRIFTLLYGVACGLLVLKFLWKGFQIYVLWRDGDSEVSPKAMLIGAMLAIVVCAGFPTVYNMSVDLSMDVGKSILEQIGDRGLLPYMSEEQLNQMANESLNSLSSVQHGAAVIPVKDWFSLLDENGDGWVTEDEALYLYDLNADGQWQASERQTYLNAVWGLSVTIQELEENPSKTYSFSLESVERDNLRPVSITKDTYRQWFTKRYTWNFDQSVAKMNFIETLVVLIYSVAFFFLWLRMLSRGLEMLVLRVGLPLAAIGLIDSDGGVFKNFTKILLRQMITSVFQVAMMRLSIMLMLDLSFFGVCAGIAALITAFRAPVLLSEIMTPQGRPLGLGQKLYSTVMMARMLGKGGDK